MTALSKIMILNGPNLNMLGVREPEIYGHQTLADIDEMCKSESARFGFEVDLRQSNSQGEIVGWIQEAFKESYDGLIINAGAYTHTSLAIHDALKLLNCPVIEVHLSNPKERESFRHFSYVELVAAQCFAGHGAQGYVMALEKMKELL